MATETDLVHPREKPLPFRVYNRIRRSFLLSFSVFGIVMVGLGGVVAQLVSGDGTWPGVIAASGVVIFFINLLGYFVYKALEWYF